MAEIRQGERRLRAIGLGAGGHAKLLVEALLAEPRVEIVGLLDPDPKLAGIVVLDVPVLGGDELLTDGSLRGVSHFFVGVGGAGDNALRRRLFARGLRLGLEPLSAIHPRAIVSSHAQLGRGVAVLPAAVVNPGARIGDDVVVNTGAVVEHDCAIEDHVHVAPNATLCGSVRVGRAAHVGAGAVVRQGLVVGARAVVGAGAVVVNDVPPRRVVAGVPARSLGAKP